MGGLGGGVNFADGLQETAVLRWFSTAELEFSLARNRRAKGHVAECNAGQRSADLGVGRAAGKVVRVFLASLPRSSPR